MPHIQKTGTLARTHLGQVGLPRGSSTLPRAEAGAAQLDRLLRAMIAAAAEGYAGATVGEVVRRARVSRRVFYQHFADRDECFLAAADAGIELLFEHISAATRSLPPSASAADHLRASIRAYLRFLSEEPEFARCFLVAALAAGPVATDRFAAAQARFATRNRRWHQRARQTEDRWPPVPDAVHCAAVGALHQLVVGPVRSAATKDLADLEDVAFDIHIALYLGWPR